MALMELGDKIQNRKYEDYVLKNMKFIFDKTNQSYFHRLYDKTFREGGWRAVPRLTWHMIYRNKRLDDNGPMGASLITLNQRHPDEAFQQYVETTNHHLMVSEPRLADGTIARLWPHENTVWADDAFMAVSFISRMGEVTGEKKYFDDAANQILNYTRYLWCPEKQIYYHCYHTDNKEHGVAHWSRANGWIFMATADLLARMPEDHPMRDDVIKNFQMQASGVARYQGKNGLWHQLLDKADSYEEITGTSMFVFGIAKGVKEGWSTTLPTFTIYKGEDGQDEPAGSITVSIEAGTIGLGTILPATSIDYYQGEQLSSVVLRLLQNTGFDWRNNGSATGGFYLKAIGRGGIASGAAIPDELMEHLKKVNCQLSSHDANWIGEFDFTMNSGWMYFVNGEYMNVGMSSCFPGDGDEVRLRFTLYSGADLGVGSDGEVWGDW